MNTCLNYFQCSPIFYIFIFCFRNFSRSQCIINIRSATKFEGEDDYQTNNAVLSIVDLAGAEREKKTGNQVPLFFSSYNQIVPIR